MNNTLQVVLESVKLTNIGDNLCEGTTFGQYYILGKLAKYTWCSWAWMYVAIKQSNGQSAKHRCAFKRANMKLLTG